MNLVLDLTANVAHAALAGEPTKRI